MDAFYPRLLVSRFAECFRFYDAVLPVLMGAERGKGEEGGPYAHWEREGRTVLALFDRAMQAAVVPLATGAGQDGLLLVWRVAEVDAALAHCLAHGGTLITPAADRPAWGPSLRTAHVRDPQGTLLELQSYQD
ncbi:VOC family protein [Kitasatospora sp. NPDC058965]|uniref:VOC family protein n=1 Tax=Kitasatospora sp. NPDC058965 TaxID=3346682 RepID=UPI0036D1210C